MKIVLIGAGNVAAQLGTALKEKGYSVDAVNSHTLSPLDSTASVYILAVKDSALPEVLQKFPVVKGLIVHTAGSVPMDIFKDSGVTRYGVFYPLQTFSKDRKISFDHIPVFTEANHPEDERLLEQIASSLSDTVIPLSSEKRKQLHLAAVFACNFTNHLYDVAAQILENQGIDWKVLLPLIEETAAKVQELSPREAQTGPAVRGDIPVIEKHLELLKNDPGKQEIYRVLSQDIYQ